MKKQIFTVMVGTAVLAMSPVFAMMGDEVPKGQTTIKVSPSHAEDEITFPKPSGQYSVGYENFEFTEENREDPYNPGHNRKLKVTVWYPSQDALKLEPYGLEENSFWKRELIEELDPYDLEQAMGQVNRLRVYKSANAVPAQELFPVILFEHGFGMTAGSYQSLFQELVSHGYIVVSTHHPHAADTVIFQNGEEVLQDRKKAETEDTILQTCIKECLDDMPFVISSLPNMKPLVQFMDLKKIGMAGHSLGGMTTMGMAKNDDPYIKAALQLDAPMPTALAQRDREPLYASGFNMPFLHVFADGAFKHGLVDDSDENNIVVILSKDVFQNDFDLLSMKENNFKAIITDTEHGSFVDNVLLKDMLPFIKENGWTCGAGKSNGLKINHIVAPLIRSFFDRFLKNQTEIDLMALNDEDIHIETAQ